MNSSFKAFLEELQNHSEKFFDLFSDVLTMHEIGNKTHGDMAEIAFTTFANKFLSSEYSAEHVGKDLFRKKTKEEDSVIFYNEEGIPISIKAYGAGPLQLSTDKDHHLYPFLESFNQTIISDKETINLILNNEYFKSAFDLNILSLIYNDNKKIANMMAFNFDIVIKKIAKIEKILPSGRRKHPIYQFLDENDNYLFEVRYGGKDANALQRGLWTNTNKAENYFISVSNGWIKYEIRENLLSLISMLMISDNNLIDKLLKEATEKYG